ncbi:hypothetical protein ALC53_02542 [Atta colombica]|uniref:Uncharacterized protein n=1 Tax=Atta colombica TaxID=520822 RepID=A0A195BRZ3_9HYME|nr:hypothetical protein ALC53_02542 [Atta colombica]
MPGSRESPDCRYRRSVNLLFWIDPAHPTSESLTFSKARFSLTESRMATRSNNEIRSRRTFHESSISCYRRYHAGSVTSLSPGIVFNIYHHIFIVQCRASFSQWLFRGIDQSVLRSDAPTIIRGLPKFVRSVRGLILDLLLACADQQTPVRRKGPEVAANRRANLRASRRARRAPAAPAPTLTAFLCHPLCPGGGTHTGLGYRTSPLPFLSHFLARGLVSSAFFCIFVFCFVNSRYSPAVPLKHVKRKRSIIIDNMKMRDAKRTRD